MPNKDKRGLWQSTCLKNKNFTFFKEKINWQLQLLTETCGHLIKSVSFLSRKIEDFYRLLYVKSNLQMARWRDLMYHSKLNPDWTRYSCNPKNTFMNHFLFCAMPVQVLKKRQGSEPQQVMSKRSETPHLTWVNFSLNSLVETWSSFFNLT